MIRKLLLAATVLVASNLFVSSPANAGVILNENFNSVAGLSAAGWTFTNNSAPAGTTGWFQGNSGVFDSQAGAADAYIAANYLNADAGGAVSNWLISPILSFDNFNQVTFYTRSSGFFEDLLEVRYSTNGASGNVGGTSGSIGDFSNLLLSINPALNGSYPTDWTAYTLQFTGLDTGTLGRLAFRYVVTDTNVYGDYIGIDSLNVYVPEPSTIALFAMSLLGFAWMRRRFVL